MLSLKNIFALLEEAIDFDSTEEAVKSYQYAPDDSTFAFIFTDVYKIAISLSKKYSIINSQDVMSTAMIECHNAIRDYDFSHKVKFSTLYTKYLTNSLGSQMKSLNYQKRQVHLLSDSYDGMVANGYDIENNLDFSACEIMSILPKDLSDLELKYCQIVLTNSQVDDTDIAVLLQISNVKVSRIKKKLQQKLQFLAA